ncbi:MAG TPA: aminotransferase class I/II-fold pyridoxal phosphate-dependent enzyme [Gammaproteobacteria bacterium]
MAIEPPRIHLSPPHLSGKERELIEDAFRSNWIAPLGPHVDAFEQEFAKRIGVRAAAATSSGTAALHLALLLAGVRPGDEVLVSTLTFAGSVFPIRYVSARPVFIDSETRSWNLDPDLVVETVERKVSRGRPPAAIIVVHLYGQSADLAPILAVGTKHGIPVIEDAAESLGATYHGASVGSFARASVFSFNGNKIITNSGGGMLATDDPDLAARARKLASQSREAMPHYEHVEIGYNYRMSNLLAAVGRAQLQVLDQRVAARRRNFRAYEEGLGDLPGVRFMPEADWGRATRWLTALTIDPAHFGVDRETVRLRLEAANIESRPVWKPMHLQPVFAGCEAVGTKVAELLFRQGLCLPSGSDLQSGDISRTIEIIRRTHEESYA